MPPLSFLTTEFFVKAATIPADAVPVWGKMNPQQMIEHLSDSVRIANGGHPHAEILTPAERLQAVQDFLRSDRDFKPGTKNALMGEEPRPVRMTDMKAALAELEAEVNRFVMRFTDEPGLVVRNPFFGDLGFEDWQRLFHKHFLHHLRQFNAA